MQPTPSAPPVQPAPAKKSNAPMIIGIIAAAVLSLCCCLPGVINVISPFPYTSETSGIFGGSTSSGTLPAYAGIVCLCAALVPWLVVGIVALVQRSKK
jgi:hypothetical protein